MSMASGEMVGLICRLVEVDDFVRRLWELYKQVKKEGIVQVYIKPRSAANSRIYH